MDMKHYFVRVAFDWILLLFYSRPREIQIQSIVKGNLISQNHCLILIKAKVEDYLTFNHKQSPSRVVHDRSLMVLIIIFH